MQSTLAFDDLLADGFVIGAILLCWWIVAGIVSLPGVVMGASLVTDALGWLSTLLVVTGIGNASVYAIARGIALSNEARFA
jgi:hypothetical protein